MNLNSLTWSFEPDIQRIMADELKKLVKIRGGHRANLKKTLAVTEELLTQSTEISEETQASDFEIKLTQQRVILNEKLTLLKSFDDKIILLVEDGNIEDELSSADDIRQVIQKSIVHVDLILEKLKKRWSKDIGSSSLSLEGSQSQATPPPTSNNTVRLPKLELKHFNGNIMERTSFWDSYSSSIHDNPNLSDIDKFNYLHSLLEKSAAEAKSGLKITSANYQEAIYILDKRFGNQQQIVNAHMNALLNLPKVNNVEDLKGLRQLHDKVEGHMRRLKSLEVESGTYGNLLTPILINKLPKELRLEAAKQLKENWDLDELIKIFKRELEARERASLLPGSSKDTPSKSPFKPKISSAASLLATGGSPTCTYCQQPHPSNSCSTVTDKNERKDPEILKRSGRCYICLRKNHVARECKSKIKCFKCDKRHHISICPSNSKIKPSPPEHEAAHQPNPHEECPRMQPQGHQRTDQNKEQPQDTHVNMFVNAQSSILLQTARATIYNPKYPSKTSQARLIFDSGSQRSYITFAMRGKLNLPTVRKDTLKINAFGSKGEDITSCDMVQFQLGTERGHKLNLSAYVVPLICSTIGNQNTRFAQQSYEHLSGLKLADSGNDGEEFDLDILIGSDYYWQLVTGHVIHGNDGPTAMHTQLGWILSGPVKGAPPNSHSNVNIASTHVLRCSTQPIPSPEVTIEANLKRFWELESIGISPDERSVYEEFLSTLTHRDGRYEVHLPWRITKSPYRTTTSLVSGGWNPS